MSLDELERNEEENEINYLKKRLEETNNMMACINKQLEEIKESVEKFHIKKNKKISIFYFKSYVTKESQTKI